MTTEGWLWVAIGILWLDSLFWRLAVKELRRERLHAIDRQRLDYLWNHRGQ